jgi:hypothetical protein
LTKKRVVEKEVYRDIAVAKKDLDYLVKRAIALGQQELQIYLSNLDLFQSPILLNQFASAVSDVRAANDDFPIIMRGLSTVHSFVYADKHHSDVINHLVKAGLRRIGFGIDGSTPELWKATKKPNTKNECLNAIVTTRERYHLTPETLMVFGHNDHDNEKSMQLAYTFLKDMQERCRALPRPHVAKSVIPGNDGWYDNSNRDTVDILLSNPSLFQSLDFTALPSTITHPNVEFRAVVKKYFLDVCGLNSSLTQYVIPEEPRMTATELESVRSFNQGRYDI